MDSKTFEIKHKKILIGEEWLDSSSGETRKLINPATEEILCEVAEGGASDIEKAAQKAREAFSSKGWLKQGGSGRAKLLWKLADLLERDGEEIALLETLNMGKPIFESRYIDVPFTANLLRYYAGWADKLEGTTIPTMPGFFSYTLREPVEVVGLIVPWNFPLLLTCWKVAPALAAGCTVVIKPSPLTPLSALKLGALCLEGGFPAGVVNIVPGDIEAGKALVESPQVNKIAFTGSTHTGKEVMKSASNTLKRISLELGGKSPNLVFADGDLSQAAQGACAGIFYNKGEICSAGSRLLVEKTVQEEFLKVLEEKMGRYQPGDPLNEKTKLGPQVSKEHREKILGYIEQARKEGAKVFKGGQGTSVNSKGFFMEPTVLTEVTNQMTVAREEIFGPVLSVIPFETEEEALSLANDTPYGLAAGIWTKDIAKAHRLAGAIQAGTVWVNTYNMYHPGSPFGGFKESGFGRELGKAALEEYTEVKSVWIGTK